MNFKIEQIALHFGEEGFKFLNEFGLTEWSEDNVTARGLVNGNAAENVANLKYNYQVQDKGSKVLEFEKIEYTKGENFLPNHNCVSHIGMHVTETELVEVKRIMEKWGIKCVQEVETTKHTNPAIAGIRRYKYCIYDTTELIGVRMKFIVRINLD